MNILSLDIVLYKSEKAKVFENKLKSKTGWCVENDWKKAAIVWDSDCSTNAQ